MPSPPDKNVQANLQEFLEWNAKQNSEGYTIANLMLRQEQFFTGLTEAQNRFMSDIRRSVKETDEKVKHLNGRVADVETDNTDIHARLDHHGAAIIAIKRRVRVGPHDQEMDTGQHDLAAIQARVAEQEQRRRDSERVKAEDQIWWRRSVIGWAAVVIGFVSATVITTIITLAVANGPARTERPLPVPTSTR